MESLTKLVSGKKQGTLFSAIIMTNGLPHVYDQLNAEKLCVCRFVLENREIGSKPPGKFENQLNFINKHIPRYNLKS